MWSLNDKIEIDYRDHPKLENIVPWNHLIKSLIY